MKKVTIGTFEIEKDDSVDFLTIDDLIALGEKYPTHNFVFTGTDYSPVDFGSWRGSYDLPRIGYGEGGCSGKQFALILSIGLDNSHYGYKGGEYRMCGGEVPYIDNYGECNEASIYGFDVVGGDVELLTAENPY